MRLKRLCGLNSKKRLRRGRSKEEWRLKLLKRLNESVICKKKLRKQNLLESKLRLKRKLTKLRWQWKQIMPNVVGSSKRQQRRQNVLGSKTRRVLPLRQQKLKGLDKKKRKLNA